MYCRQEREDQVLVDKKEKIKYFKQEREDEVLKTRR